MGTVPQKDQAGDGFGFTPPPIVSAEAWEAARQQMLAEEKAFTRARDALAAGRRRMP